MILITAQVWTIRRGPELEKFGDHYDHTAIVTRVGDTAYIEAWSGKKPRKAEVAALREYMRDQGIRYAAWERRKDGKIHYAKFEL